MAFNQLRVVTDCFTVNRRCKDHLVHNFSGLDDIWDVTFLPSHEERVAPAYHMQITSGLHAIFSLGYILHFSTEPNRARWPVHPGGVFSTLAFPVYQTYSSLRFKHLEILRPLSILLPMP